MSDKPETDSAEPLPRRNFFKQTLAVILGGIAALIPATAGLLVFLDPLRRKTESAGAIRVTSLTALPSDGKPYKFPVVASRTDAWNKFPDVPIGAVYLRRTGETKIEALNVVCPHAGCFVDFLPSRDCFLCPCHNSTFALDGTINDPKSPSPRPLDTLTVEIRGQEIYVNFQNFRAGSARKIPAA